MLAFALVAFVVHHPDACKHEQYGHDKVEYTIAVRQGPEYIDSEPTRQAEISYAVFCLKKKKKKVRKSFNSVQKNSG